MFFSCSRFNKYTCCSFLLMGKFYAVARGRNSGIYNSWSDCKQQTDGFSKAKFKSFRTRGEAEEFMRENGASDNYVKNEGYYSFSQNEPSVELDEDDYEEPEIETEAERPILGKRRRFTNTTIRQTRKRRKIEAIGTVKDSIENNLKSIQTTLHSLLPLIKKRNEFKNLEPMSIYTDGACQSNGQRKARAGVGVYFGPNDGRNVSRKLPGRVQTNNRAELTAILDALNTVKKEKQRSITIHTDSIYSMKGITGVNQIKKNKDLFDSIFKSLREVKKNNTVEFKKVKAHTGIKDGNYYADDLAVKGINK